MQSSSATQSSQPHEPILTSLTADIVSAYVTNHNVSRTEIGALIADVYSSLKGTTGAPASFAATEVVEKQKPAVSIRKSITEHELTCLECGHGFKSLKRHLMTHHEMSPADYREKWSLAPDYPMVAPEYSLARSNLAKKMGLGASRSRGPNKKSAKA